MKPTVLTPYYLRAENGEIYRTSFTNDSTSYTVRPEWARQHLPATPVGTAAPQLAEWSTLPVLRHPQQVQLNGAEDSQETKKAYAQIYAKADDKYKQAYHNLIKNLAYRYPNPGDPRYREGSSGGTWRHVKGVLGHNGSRIAYVDGRVSLYDDESFTQELQGQLKCRPHLRAFYMSNTSSGQPGAALTLPVLAVSNALEEDTRSLAPSSSVLRDPDLLRKLELQKGFQTDRRGFYRFK